MNARTNTKGFTIIEVVLVLAIAALIFLMIFIALPALQRGQRDTARKQDVGTVASAINSYRSNHRGALPPAGNWTSAGLNTYVTELSQVAVSNTGIRVVVGSGNAPTTADSVIIYTGAKCDANNNATTVGASTKQAAVTTFLENGGAYCQTA